MKYNLSLIVIFVTTSLGFTNENLYLYFPIKDGLKWEYVVEESGKSFKQEVVCKIPVQNAQVDCDFVFETKSIRKTKYYYKISNDTIFSLKVDVMWNVLPFKFILSNSPAIPIFFLEGTWEDSAHWEWEGRLSSLFFKKNLKIKSTVKGVEKIDTKIGKLQCIKIVTNFEYENKSEKYIAWYAKRIGLVKINSSKHSKRVISFSET